MGQLKLKSKRRGNCLFALVNVRHRALAVRRRRATPGGVFAVRARGAYVFYCVEEIPRGVDASIQISQRRGNFLYTIDNVRHRTLAVRRRSAIGRKVGGFQGREGKPFRAVSLFPLETLFPSAESRTASARQACGVSSLRLRKGSSRDAGQRPVASPRFAPEALMFSIASR